MEKYNQFKQMVNDELLKISIAKEPKRLYEPINYIIGLGGKRLRPVLTLAGCDLFGGSPESALPAAIGLEVFHNFTLLHDDIMDKADVRRGKQTVHKKWNSNIAILSGDTMFALAFQQLNLTQSTQKKEMLETFTQTAIEVCEGQQFDMDFESMDYVTIPDYINMIRLKTAVLLGCSLQIGALTAEANPAQAKFIYDFGVNIGIAFQLKDDFLDSFGELEKFGKKIGGDISENKKTFLYLKCLELANADDRDGLTALYSGNQSAPDRKVKEVLQLFDKYDIKSHTINEMEKYFNQATEILDRIKVNKDKKGELQSYAKWLYKRDH